MSIRRRDSRARPVLDLGARLVERVEHTICGPHVAATPPAAAGLALAGVRTAAVSFGSGLSPGFSDDGLAYVVHSDRFSEGLPPGPVVLLAGSHQAAVDQCLLAHALSAALRCRVDALVDPRVSNGLGRVVPVSSEQVAALLENDSGGAKRGVPDESAEARVAPIFARVESVLGRSCGPVRLEGPRSGAAFLTAGCFEGVLSPLIGAGVVPMGHLALDLLRPLPLAALGAAISRGKPLVFLIPEDSTLHLEALRGLTEAAVGGELPVSRVVALEVGEGIRSSGELFEFLCRRLPADLGKSVDAASAPSPGEFRGLRVGASPGGAFEESLLLDCGADWAPEDGASGEYRLVRHGRGFVSLELGRSDDGLDLLLLRPGRVADATRAVRELRPEGAVLLEGRAGDPSAAWAQLPRSIRVELLERKAKIWWLDATGKGRRGRVAASLGHLLRGLGDGRVPPPSSESGTSDKAVPRELDAATLETAVERTTPPAASELPRMPGESDDPADGEDRTTWIRTFHLTGRKPEGMEPAPGLFPAIAVETAEAEEWRRVFPLWLPEPAEGGEAEPLPAILERLCANLGEASVLRRLLPGLADFADEAARTDPRPASVFAGALERLAGTADLSDAGRRRLAEEIEELRARLPERGEVVPFAPSAWWRLCRWAVVRAVEPRRASLAGEIERLAGELEAILAVDRGLRPQSRSPEVLGSSLGEGGLLRVDIGKLAASVPHRPGSTPLGEERRLRIERTLARLRAFLDRWRRGPHVYLVHAGLLDLGEGDAGAVSVAHPKPFDLASGLFSGFAAELVDAARAIRVAELEVTGDFDPELHQPVIDRLRWESLALDELAVLPRILVFESGRRLSTESLTDFHRLLSSARPVQVFVRLDDVVPPDGELGGVPPDMAYLGMAHREVFVLQSGLGDWSHLLEGVRRMLEAPGPAAVLMALPDEADSAGESWGRWTALRDSRSIPLCRYDPRKGVSWAERFSLDGNVHPDRAAVSRAFRYLDEEGGETTAEEACTFAHAAALDPRFAAHFLAIPRAAWSADQVLLSRYLDEYTDLPPETVPYIWTLDGRGVLRRAVITREMAHICRDRGRAWKVLQELAGWNNPHVERAVESARREVLEEAEASIRDSREAAREEGAREAVERLVTLLANPEIAAGIAPPAGKPAAPAAAEPATVEEAEPPAPEEAVEEEPSELGDPYIDSFLCTSCNDCINLNSLLFKYNQDKQAYIADATAGTYRELVKAAEVCPANCIHPGAPRPGDETATPEIIERAKPYQ